MKCSLGISNFLEEICSLSHSVVFLYLCIDHWRRLSYLSLLVFGTLHSNGYIFPLLLCLSLFFFSQLHLRPPQTTICLLAFLFLGGGLDHCLLYSVTNVHPWFFRRSMDMWALLSALGYVLIILHLLCCSDGPGLAVGSSFSWSLYPKTAVWAVRSNPMYKNRMW